MAATVEELMRDYEVKLSDYRKAIKEQIARREPIDAQIGRLEKKIETLEKQIENLQNRIAGLQGKADEIEDDINAIYEPNWVDDLVYPLASQLADRIGGDLKAVVYGPFGGLARAFIFLVKDPDASIVNQSSRTLAVQPRFDNDGKTYLVYETGEVNGAYLDPNGRNMVTATLPDSIDEIVPLLTKFGANKKGGKE